MDAKVTPTPISGEITAPSSKSFAHRMLIAAFLSGKRVKIKNTGHSDDVKVTLEALKTLGATIIEEEDGTIIKSGELPCNEVIIDCRESGSSLRFLLPVAAALGIKARFTGAKRLLERPITELLSSLNENKTVTEGLTVVGKMSSGIYKINGEVSSQYVTGLMLALSVVGGEIKIEGTLVSQPYVDITLSVLDGFGVKFEKTASGYKIYGGYNVKEEEFTVEGDWSGAAFPLALGAICGRVAVCGLNATSVQGDRKIIEILKELGAKVSVLDGSITVQKAPLKAIELDCKDIPDLVQIISVVAAYANGVTVLKNVDRLRLKESDRIRAVIDSLGAVGVKAEYKDKCLYILGGRPVGGKISGGDHRTVMSAIVLASGATRPSIITDIEASSKSYPAFIDDYKALGGNICGNI